MIVLTRFKSRNIKKSKQCFGFFSRSRCFSCYLLSMLFGILGSSASQSTQAFVPNEAETEPSQDNNDANIYSLLISYSNFR